MFESENCKIRAKTLKADEAVSDIDTVRRPEKFAAEFCNLQLEDSFSEVPKMYLLIMLLIAADLSTKWLALKYLASRVEVWPGVFHLAASRNEGIAFGIPVPNTVMLIAAPLLLILLLWLVTKECNMRSRITQSAVALLAAGGIGNFLDRLWHDGVTDFIAFSFWPSFNLGDSFLTAAVFLLLLFHARACAHIFLHNGA